MRKVIVLVLLYALLIVLGLRASIMPDMFGAKPSVDTAISSPKVEGSEGKPVYVKLEPVVVNMVNPKTGRASTVAAKVGITIEVNSLETANKMKKQMVQTRDCAISVLSTYSTERLKDSEERVKLKDDLTRRFQELAGENTIININICDLIFN